MKIFATIITVGVLMAGAALAQTNTVSTNYVFNIDQAIPDGNLIGLASSTNLSGIDFHSISSLTVSLDISGGYNGDLYAYLAGPGGTFDVLLNRAGADGSNPYGYSDSGFNIMLDDSTPNNIQTYETIAGGLPANTPVTGTWQSAGDSLSSFAGIDPNGIWTLFIADESSGGGQSILESWGLTIVTSAVPEPQSWTMCLAGILILFAGFKLRGRSN